MTEPLVELNRLAALGVVGFTIDGITSPTNLSFNFQESFTSDEFAIVREIPTLQRLMLRDVCSIAPHDLRHLAGLTSLCELDLCNCTACTDESMKYLANLPALRTLYLHCNALTDVGVKHLATLTKLEFLHLEHNRITDRSLSVIGSLNGIHRLDVGANPITDKGLDELRELRELTYLSVSNTEISDEVIDSLNRLPNLKELNLFATKVSPQGLRRLRSGITYNSQHGCTWETKWGQE